MNRARVAAALIELAEAIAEDDQATNVVALAPKPRAKPRRTTITRPPGESSPEAAAAADRILRTKGMR